MDPRAFFSMLARYSRVANTRLYASCAQLDDSPLDLHRIVNP
jgi:uncharacterized damage-inducible protein DinB